ncbi:hypothetical protein ECG_06109 [Echinococcus granulosus]|nr:hypothetical protein ECG_06109 [Echinococcus granulosus]
MDDSGVEHVAPALDVAFPVMHAYNLQLTDTIAVQLGEVDGAKQESRDLLRPSVRLLCSIGRCGWGASRSILLAARSVWHCCCEWIGRSLVASSIADRC